VTDVGIHVGGENHFSTKELLRSSQIGNGVKVPEEEVGFWVKVSTPSD
jgi:hypothetical protein